ncbi:sensor histidine kinase [Marinomonas ostreistagni]|uniref:histidine kinase n=1 Tax=Marinomonas ostreistagni TaxID=359209 RepID=A0ABS0Z5Y4_9GAMM|nr:HAMP domain-containing sensor histidine kinase [Marinomonas ostreistagni]MBJ7549074.1 HAMP domain-containing histidine kinase [Marinomonas ostreistagni]
MPPFLQNAKSMTGRLALFFIAVSIVVGAICLILISLVLTWSEDRVGERRIMIDKQSAMTYFQETPWANTVKLDPLTTAYNGLANVPVYFREFLEHQPNYIGEAGEGENSRMLFSTHFMLDGEERQLVLISRIEEIEITHHEFVNVMALVLGVVALLIGAFTTLLTRLSKSLIRPINQLCDQLEQHQENSHKAFSVPRGSAREFQMLAATLNQYKNDLNSTIKREQAFARYASHELRTPLTLMKGSSSMLAKQTETPFAKRQVERIQRATEQMLVMVDALLGLVRYEKSQDNAPVRTIEAKEIESLVQKHQSQADSKQLTLTCQISGFPSTRATPAVLEMIVGNLIRNSIAASKQGIINITMHETYIEVSDEGEGFETTKTSDSGHGLGLLIVEDICQRYHWQFVIKNRAEGGCVATLTMPSEQ